MRDEIGREVRLKAFPARRVVSLAASTTEVLYALGAGDTVVGVDTFSDWPPEAARVAQVGTEQEPSVEKIVALRPDVVLMSTTANRQETGETIERLGIPVFVSKVESLAGLDQSIRDLGLLVGRDAGATALTARLHAGLDEVRKQVADAPRVPALIVVWSDPLFVVGKDTYTGELLAAAGGTNVAEDAGSGYPKYSLERVLRHAPEVIFVGSHKTNDADPVGYWRRWPSLPAVKNGRLHAVDGDPLFRPSPRAIDGVRALAAALHPERIHAARP